MECEDALSEQPALITKPIVDPKNNMMTTNGHIHASCPANLETVVHLKFLNSPVTFWKRRFKDRPFWYKIQPMDMSRRDSEIALENYNGEESSNINDLVQENSSIKIAVMKDGLCKLQAQGQFGHKYDPDEFVLFATSIVDSEKLAYMIDFYLDDMSHKLPIPEHVGFCTILPSNLRGNTGSCTMPIIGKKHHPIGQVSIEYLIIKPLSGYEPCEMNFARNWKLSKKGLDVGHRGAGFARRTDKVENVLENTVASFNYAAAHGADMVELDVQLTKDLVPVIYHDYFINIAMKKKKSIQEHEFLQIPIKDLSLNQLHALKLSPVRKPAKPEYDFLEDDPQDNQPFPTLEHILEAVDERCGFNVEIKYPMQRQDGSWDGNWDRLCDLNEYVDIIVKTVIEHAKNRDIIFSCFHPDICSMVVLKQNKYPLLFLTQGKTEKWSKFWDPRAHSIPMAAFFAKSMGFLGIDVHAEDLLKDRTLIKFVKDRDLTLFVWGDDLMDKGVIKQLKHEGVDGVIYDKIDEFNTKEPAFLVESSSENRKALISIIAGSNSIDGLPDMGSWASSGGMSTNSSP